MRNSVFRTVYLIYIGLLVAASACLLWLLWKKLVAYQTEQDEKEANEEYLLQKERAPQKFFMEFAEGMDAGMLAKEWFSDNPYAMENEETCKRYFEGLLSSDEGGLTFYRDYAYTDEVPVYTADLAGREIAKITLAGKDFAWEVSDISVYAEGREEIALEVPDGYTIRCNGFELDDEFLVKSGIVRFPYDNERDSFKYGDILVNEIKWNKYSAGGFLVPPDIEITDCYGDILSPGDVERAKLAAGGSQSGDGQSGDFLKIYPDVEISVDLTDQAVGFLDAYIAYYTYGKNQIDEHIEAAQALCFPGSPADRSLINAYEDSVSWAYGHTNPRVELLAVGRPVLWADNCCTVDIKYHAYAKRGGEEVDYSRGDEMIRIVLVDKGKGYKVYAFDVSPTGNYL